MNGDKIEGLIWFLLFLFIVTYISFDKLLEVIK